VNQIPRRNTSLISASNTVVLLLSKEIAEDWASQYRNTSVNATPVSSRFSD
jgi:hypothetical protein